MTVGALGFFNTNNLPFMAILPQDRATNVWRSVDGQTFEAYTPTGLNPWTSYYQSAKCQNTTRIGNTAIFLAYDSSGVRTFRTNDFKSFSFETATISNLKADGDIVLWYDSVGGRLCIAGLDSTSENTIRIYTSTDYGASWIYQSAISSGTSTRLWCAAEGTDNIGISYDSTSGYHVIFLNKNTFTNVRTSGNTYATSGAFRFLPDLGSGGTGYGRFIAADTVGMAYWDESSSGVSAKSNVTKPTTVGSYTYIDVCYFGGNYLNMYSDESGNDKIKISYTSSLTATPTWTSAYTRTGSTPTSQWYIYSNFVAHENGVTAFLTEGTPTGYYHALFSSDGISYSEITNPSGMTQANAMGYVP